MGLTTVQRDCAACDDRLSSESERSTMYECEVSGLKEQLTSRDRVVIELNTELERVQQQITQLNNSYQTAQQQAQLAQRAMYVRLPLSFSFSARQLSAQ